MICLDLIRKLNSILLSEMPEYRTFADNFSNDLISQRKLLRSLMNMRPPIPIDSEFISLQDKLLKSETMAKGIVDIDTLHTIYNDKIILWQGDITRLNAYAIVNAANSQMLGCFYPCHGCIDNAIHSAAGLQLRDECNKIMISQKEPEKPGHAKITLAYNLPCQYVIHTVGPIVHNGLNHRLELQLASCYRSCLEIADKNKLKSIAFCCISTGEFCFPNKRAAEIAINTVLKMIPELEFIKKIVFNVYKDKDYIIYKKLLTKKLKNNKI